VVATFLRVPTTAVVRAEFTCVCVYVCMCVWVYGYMGMGLIEILWGGFNRDFSIQMVWVWV
jgi:hypothetical protein